MVEEILEIARRQDVKPYSFSELSHTHYQPLREIDNRDIVKILTGRKEDDTDNNEDSER